MDGSLLWRQRVLGNRPSRAVFILCLLLHTLQMQNGFRWLRWKTYSDRPLKTDRVVWIAMRTVNFVYTYRIYSSATAITA